MKRIITRFPKRSLVGASLQRFSTTIGESYWFPRTIDELDSSKYQASVSDDKNISFAETFSERGEEYQDRARFITSLSEHFTPGQRVPEIEYTAEEVELWKDIYQQIDELQLRLAGKSFLASKQRLVDADVLTSDEIPQLDRVSRYLQRASGFELRPVGKFIGPRQFLNSLAFKVFHSPQVIRSAEKAEYCQIPDIVHTYLGHAPLLADPLYADIFHQIGIASLGVSDKEIHQLYALYWYSCEQALIMRRDRKGMVCGAHLLSNIRQLKKIEADEFPVKGFSLIELLSRVDGFNLKEHDETLFLAENKMGIKDIILEFATSCKRPFKLYFDQQTQSVNVGGRTYMFMTSQ